MNQYKPKFKDAEFACKCCGKGRITDALREKLEASRVIAGIPFVVNSGFRCADNQNDLIARGLSEPTSSHPKGLAVDVKAIDSDARFRIVDAAPKAGITRIGIAKDFIHLDIDQDKPQNLIWLYED
mgnify:CR=1 FL=1